MKLDRGMDRLFNERERLIRRIRNLSEPLAKDLADIRLDWYSIRNAAEADTTEVFLYESIGGWFGVDASQFVAELNAITTPNIKMRINSPGGSVFDSIAIYNALVAHPSYIHVCVDSLAASGASIIAMGGDRVTMMVGSQLMIHDAAGVEMGDARMMREMADFLDAQSQNIASIYAHHMGGDVNDVRDMMLAETWMFAEEAVTLGFATDVYVKEDTGSTGGPTEGVPAEEVVTDDDSEEGTTDDADEEVDVEDLMRVRHTLTNRGYKFTGRKRAPAPVIDDEIDVDKLIAGFKSVLGRK